MSKLFMVGDSFAAAPKVGDSYKPWYIQATEKLKMNCENHSMIGVSQDWCFWKLSMHFKELTADDQILVVLTHPGRFWFFDDKPQMTNPNIVNIDKELSKDQLDAVLKFMTHIQRPPLDIQQMSHRLGWLNSQIERYKLKPAHILSAFPLMVDIGYDMSELEDWSQYKNVIISNGNLQNDIQIKELKQGEPSEYKVWKGYDCRYNHLIKSNHEVLAERVYQGITNGTPIDLKTPGFKTNVIQDSIFEDKDFIEKELEPFAITQRKKYLETEYQEPWMKTSGLMDLFKKKGLR